MCLDCECRQPGELWGVWGESVQTLHQEPHGLSQGTQVCQILRVIFNRFSMVGDIVFYMCVCWSTVHSSACLSHILILI